MSDFFSSHPPQDQGSMSSLIELQIWGRMMLLFIVTALTIVTTFPILLCWVLRQVLEGVPNSSLSLCWNTIEVFGGVSSNFCLCHGNHMWTFLNFSVYPGHITAWTQHFQMYVYYLLIFISDNVYDVDERCFSVDRTAKRRNNDVFSNSPEFVRTGPYGSHDSVALEA